MFCPNEAPGLADCWGKEFEKLYTEYEKEVDQIFPCLYIVVSLFFFFFFNNLIVLFCFYLLGLFTGKSQEGCPCTESMV